MKSKRNLIRYLEIKELSQSEINYLIDSIYASLDKLEIPVSILRLNPTIDPLLQNDLFMTLINEGLDDWLITRYPLSGEGAFSENVDFNEKNFYYQFLHVIKQLDTIFGVENEINRYSYGGATISQIVYYATMWLEQKPIRELVDSELRYHVNEGGDIDTDIIDRTIRNIVKHIKNDVSFKLVKYVKLLSDIMGATFTEEELKGGLNSMLPEMIEFGAVNIDVLTMIRSGITRSASIDISKLIPRDQKKDPISWIMKNDIPGLLPLHKRYLVNQGFWSADRARARA